MSQLLASEAALEFLKANPMDPVNVQALESSCGIGLEVTPEQVEECVGILSRIIILYIHALCIYKQCVSRYLLDKSWYSWYYLTFSMCY